MSSSFTRNSIVAFIVALMISFTLFIIGPFLQFLPQSVQPFFGFLAIGKHFESISRGVIDSRDIIYYFSVMGICLLVATLSLESRRWN
jgi:ABC-2 type transport system permease protein